MHRATGGRGFTLIEMLLVSLILGALIAIALPQYRGYVERTRIAQAVIDIRGLEPLIAQYQLENRSLPASLADIGRAGILDPWKNPYEYTNLSNLKGNGAARKDKNLVPINSDYDLYSKGPDAKSTLALTAKNSRDDIVRANDGRFVGVAADY